MPRGYYKITKPITPKECEEQKIKVIDPKIIQAINALLLEKYNGQYSLDITQDEIIEKYFEITKKNDITPLSRAKLFETNQLDFEQVYRKAGWAVDYDKPGYNEDYDAHYTFKVRKKS